MTRTSVRKLHARYINLAAMFTFVHKLTDLKNGPLNLACGYFLA